MAKKRDERKSGRVAIVAYEDTRRAAKASRAAALYDERVAGFLAKLGRPDPKADIIRARAYIENARRAGIEPLMTAAIVDATLGHAHLKPELMAEKPKAAEGLLETRITEKTSESPTREEWEVIVTNPPPSHLGHILNMVPPGESFVAGNKVVLWGFYDDEEAARVASAIARKYGVLVTFGPRRKAAAEVAENPIAADKADFRWHEVSFDVAPDAAKFAKLIEKVNSTIVASHQGLVVTTNATPKDINRVLSKHQWTESYRVAAEGVAAPGVSGKEACGCKTSTAVEVRENPLVPLNSAEDSECKPFTRISRDPARFDVCMRRAAEIGPLKDSKCLYELVAPDISRNDEEQFFVMTMDFRLQLRDYVMVAKGQRHKVAIDIEDILAPVYLSKCDAFAVAHCHPSGRAEPSGADRKLTKLIKEAAKVACPNVAFTDHLVIGARNEYYSFADKKLYKSGRELQRAAER